MAAQPIFEDQANKKKEGGLTKKLIDASVAVSMDAPKGEDVGFLNKHLIQANLPHRKPASDVWVRKNGRFTLTIQAGIDPENGESYGLPYGTPPRLGLIYIITEALRTKSRRIELGTSINDFLRLTGYSPDTGGGKRSDAKRVMEQLRRLFNARFSFSESFDDLEGNKRKSSWQNMEVTQSGQLWWNVKNPDQSDLFGSWIELGEAFYSAIISSPVPLDLRAVKVLKQSPLAIDCYTWLAYEAFKANSSGKSRFIPYASLFKQMGGEYNSQKEFNRHLKLAMKKALTVAPSVRLDFVEGGIKVASTSKPCIVHKSVDI